MSHEIRTPMNAILGMLQLTMLSELSTAQRGKLSHAADAARSLLRIIDDILDLSKIEAGRLELESVASSIEQVVQRLTALIRPGALDKGLQLEVTLADDVPRWLVGDPLRLGQVLLNLCGNAVKFTEQGSIRVRVERAPDDALAGARNGLAGAAGVALVFSVRDTGIGIDEADLERLFQSFSQADSSTTRRFGGTGLGLTISRRLAERMGGTIEVRSALGSGSEFRFTAAFGLAQRVASAPAPAPAGVPAPAGADPSEPAAASQVQGARVLLVEDNRVNQEVARAMLQAAGAIVTVSGDGAQAIEALAQAEFDAVLMDIQMPVLDGLEATRRLRRDPRHAGLPIIAMTANALTGDRDTCLAAGMSDYLTKPVDMQTMLAVLARHLPRRTEHNPPTNTRPR